MHKRLFDSPFVIGLCFTFIGSPNASAITFDCQNLLMAVTTVKELRRDLVHARETDPRWGLYRLTGVSPTLDRLDNFSSPAALRSLVFDWKKEKAGERILREESRRATNLVEAASAQSTVPAHVRLLFESIESRFHLAFEIVVQALEAKGRRPETDGGTYARALTQITRAVVAELRADAKYSKVFADYDFEAVDWAHVTNRIETNRSAHRRSLVAAEDRVPFQKSFLEAVDPDRSALDQIDSLGRDLHSRLEGLPVGIVHVTRTLTSAVRFGPRIFFGSWAGYHSTMRDRYLRTHVGKSITGEVVLRLSPRRKKLLALYLDRTHGKLDFVFGLERRSGRWLHTCGSYVAATFWKCGVPIVTPAFLTPGAAVASLRLQKALGLPNVEEATYKVHGTAKWLVLDGAILAGHEVWMTIWEINLLLDLGSGLGYLVNSVL